MTDRPPPPLPDGRYDVFVVDAEGADDGSTVAVEFTVLGGEHKGAVIRLAVRLGRDALDLLGTPGTLSVVGGEPKLTLEG